MNKELAERCRVQIAAAGRWFLGLIAAAACVCALPAAVRAADNVGTGGTITYTDAGGANPQGTPIVGGYVVHTFTGNGTLALPVDVNANYLIVAGGGGGGSGYGGGGGAGGMLTGSTAVSAGSHEVVVGGGGPGGAASQGTDGDESSFNGLTADGGGGGGAFNVDSGNGRPGGCGGGAAGNGSVRTGGSGTQGGSGGNGGAGTSGRGGGGGGAGGAGVTGTTVPGSGGAPLASSISGTSTYYAQGGCAYNAVNVPDYGGGDVGESGTANTGGGGGADGGGGGGAGGSGIVIVRYPYIEKADNVGTGGTITYTDSSGQNSRSAPAYIGGYAVHTFTGNGTLGLPVDVNADYLIVAGGGGGGSGYGGGGGAGGMLTGSTAVSAGSHGVVVGGGGPGGASSQGTDGDDSTFNGLTADGGGGGGAFNVDSGNGRPGGCGGGAAGNGSVRTGGSGTQGGSGGNGGAGTSGRGGGGGGAGGDGVTGTTIPGSGGAPLASSISGTSTYYAQGGCAYNAVNVPDYGGGDVGESGTANTGGGGGADGGGGGGSGGSGIVIVRYPYVLRVQSPTFGLPAGGYVGEQSVAISCTTDGATTHYTTNGDDPTTGSDVYSSAITVPVNTTMTIKALAVKAGYTDSVIASATYITSDSGTWTNPNGGSWPTPGNWLGGVVGQGSGVPVYFDTLTLGANAAVTLDGARTVGGLAFADVGDAYDWTINPGSGGPLTLAGTGTPEIDVASRTVTIVAGVAGTQGLTKTGDGTLVFQGVNTLSGGVTIDGGTLDWQNTPNAGAGTITVNAPGTAKFHGTSANYGYTVPNDLAGDGAVTARAALGSGSIYNGTGYVTFSGDLSAFTGTFTVDTTLNFVQLPPAATADGSGAKWIVNRSSGICYLSVPAAATYKLGELSGNGALGAFYTSGTTTWEVGALGSDSTYNGVIVNTLAPGLGVAALKKVGAGKLTLTSASSAYSGGTLVEGGILEVGVNGRLGVGNVEVTTGKLSLLGGAAIADSAELRLPNVADKLEIAASVNEIVGKFFVGGIGVPPGTWGRIGNTQGARETLAITGDGILTVVDGPPAQGSIFSFK